MIIHVIIPISFTLRMEQQQQCHFETHDLRSRRNTTHKPPTPSTLWSKIKKKAVVISAFDTCSQCNCVDFARNCVMKLIHLSTQSEDIPDRSLWKHKRRKNSIRVCRYWSLKTLVKIDFTLWQCELLIWSHHLFLLDPRCNRAVNLVKKMSAFVDRLQTRINTVYWDD